MSDSQRAGLIRVALARFDPGDPSDPDKNAEFWGQVFDVQATDDEVKFAVLRAVRGLSGSLVMDPDGYRKA